jgi:flagellar basal-body rod protein FlgF
MEEIFQILASTQGQEMQMAQIANNLANVNTVGYKEDRSAFVDHYEKALRDSGLDPATIARLKSANPSMKGLNVLGDNYIDFSAGSLQPTGQPLDLAIEGDGVFQVEVQGEKEHFYTRAGNFHVNDKSELVTVSGHRVLDASGSPIKLTLTNVKPTVTETGEIMVGGETVAKLGVVTFPEPSKMTKFGETLFRGQAQETPKAVEKPKVRQGMLENSNVNPIFEMIRMIEVERSYEAHQKLINTIDEVTARRIEALDS